MKRAPFAHIFVLITFLVNTFGPVPLAQAQELRLPVPGVMVNLSPPENPPVLKGVTVYPNNPFKFDFILDKGDSNNVIPAKAGIQNQEQLKQESAKLVKYFLASITTPENDLWVNLSPYEKNRIIPKSFGQTDMGRDLLGEDYILKQITASLIYPEGEIGKQFWKRVYEEARKKYGTTNIPINTFNKVWIVPEHAKVYEHGNTAFVVKAKLKVMLEQDYLALSKNMSLRGAEGDEAISERTTNSLGSQIVREIVIPELSKEVNEGKNFATLRQVYYSLILAVWFKKRMKDSLLGRKYMDQNKVTGIHYNPLPSLRRSKNSNVSLRGAIGDEEISKRTSNDIESIYQRYLKAFKKGVYNYIKEEPDPMTQETIPKKYFSGGAEMSAAMTTTEIEQTLSTREQRDLPDSSQVLGVKVNLANGNPSPTMKSSSVDKAILVQDFIDHMQSWLDYFDFVNINPFRNNSKEQINLLLTKNSFARKIYFESTPTLGRSLRIYHIEIPEIFSTKKQFQQLASLLRGEITNKNANIDEVYLGQNKISKNTFISMLEKKIDSLFEQPRVSGVASPSSTPASPAMESSSRKFSRAAFLVGGLAALGLGWYILPSLLTDDPISQEIIDIVGAPHDVRTKDRLDYLTDLMSKNDWFSVEQKFGPLHDGVQAGSTEFYEEYLSLLLKENSSDLDFQKSAMVHIGDVLSKNKIDKMAIEFPDDGDEVNKQLQKLEKFRKDYEETWKEWGIDNVDALLDSFTLKIFGPVLFLKSKEKLGNIEIVGVDSRKLIHLIYEKERIFKTIWDEAAEGMIPENIKVFNIEMDRIFKPNRVLTDEDADHLIKQLALFSPEKGTDEIQDLVDRMVKTYKAFQQVAVSDRNDYISKNLIKLKGQRVLLLIGGEHVKGLKELMNKAGWEVQDKKFSENDSAMLMLLLRTHLTLSASPAMNSAPIKPDPEVLARRGIIRRWVEEHYDDLMKNPNPRLVPKFGTEIKKGIKGDLYRDPRDPAKRNVYKVYPTTLTEKEGYYCESGIMAVTNLIDLRGISGVPRLLDWGVMKDGKIWAHMEEIENATSITIPRGESTVISKEWLKLNYPQRIGVFAKVAKILQAAHERGISHNDVNGRNILINNKGEVMVIDWDIAKAIGEKQPGGTWGYEAPEKIKQDQSDVYSLQVTMYKVLSAPNTGEGATDLRNLRQRMNNKDDPNARLTMKEVAETLGGIAQKTMDIEVGLKEVIEGLKELAPENTNLEQLLMSEPVIFQQWYIEAHKDQNLYHSIEHSLRVAISAYRLTLNRYRWTSIDRKAALKRAIFMFQVGLVHDFQPNRAPDTPADVVETLKLLEQDWEGKASLSGQHGESVLQKMWTQEQYLEARLIIYLSDYPNSLQHLEKIKQEGILQEIYEFDKTGEELVFALEAAYILPEYSDKGNGYLTTDFRDTLKLIERLSIEKKNAGVNLSAEALTIKTYDDFLSKLGSPNSSWFKVYSEMLAWLRTEKLFEPIRTKLEEFRFPDINEASRWMTLDNLEYLDANKAGYEALAISYQSGASDDPLRFEKAKEKGIEAANQDHLTRESAFIHRFGNDATSFNTFLQLLKEKDPTIVGDVLKSFQEKVMGPFNTFNGYVRNAKTKNDANAATDLDAAKKGYPLIVDRIQKALIDINRMDQFQELSKQVTANTFMNEFQMDSTINQQMDKLIGIVKDFAADRAMTTIEKTKAELGNPVMKNLVLGNKSAPGGIDLTPKRMNLEVEKDKAVVSQPMDLKVLENIEINGLYIKDIQIKPLKNLPELLGVSSSATS